MDYTWATNKLGVGRRVRRHGWPQRTVQLDDGTTATTFWHVWVANGYRGRESWQSGIVQGWGPVEDGLLYSPTEEDREAGDWELLDMSSYKNLRRRR
jgi:hypothetical protein